MKKLHVTVAPMLLALALACGTAHARANTVLLYTEAMLTGDVPDHCKSLVLGALFLGLAHLYDERKLTLLLGQLYARTLYRTLGGIQGGHVGYYLDGGYLLTHRHMIAWLHLDRGDNAGYLGLHIHLLAGLQLTRGYGTLADVALGWGDEFVHLGLGL